MPKRPNNLPNLRIDIPDYEQNGYVFTVDSFKHFVDRSLAANRAAVLEGLRVEIANQSSNPGLFTIYSGVALDRDGQIVDNESDLAAQRSQTLSADGTYFVEVQFTTTESDTDARAFWDPLYDNGTDPSGDERTNGREFDVNVSTRQTPDWTIVTPISTIGFASTTDADSARIPVAVLTVSGGQITGGTTYAARTILEDKAAVSATSIRVFNSRIFPDTFTATLGGTAITVTANDRDNGILTLAAGLAAEHIRGERLIQTGSDILAFLAERTNGTIPTSGTEDARRRMWQGDEERGYALWQDPYTSSGNSDLEIKSLKDYIDYLAAIVREMKFGSARASDLGEVAPPSTFSTSPKYYERAGSLAGSRTATVTIGDGTTSFGDYNVNSAGSFKAAFDAAYAALPAQGGRIHIKSSTSNYEVSSTITLDSSRKVIISGDGPYSTVIEAQSTAQVFSLGTTVKLENLGLLRDSAATSSSALELDTGAIVSATNCRIDALTCVDIVDGCSFTNCTFIATNASGVKPLFLAMTNSSFRDCSFTTSISSAAAYALQTDTGCSNVLFDNCKFTAAAGVADYVCWLNSTTLSAFVFRKCEFSGGDTDTVAVLVGNSLTDTIFENCVSTCSGGFIYGSSAVDHLTAKNCRVSYANTKKGYEFSSATSLQIVGGEVTQASGGTTGVGIQLDSVTDSEVSGVEINLANYGISVLTSDGLIISRCRILGQGNCVDGIRGQSGCTIANTIIDGCLIDGGNSLASAATVTGINVGASGASGAFSDSSIVNNVIINIGQAGNTVAYGIFLDGQVAHERILVANNTIRVLQSAGTDYCLYAYSLSASRVLGNQMECSIGSMRIANSADGVIISNNYMTAAGDAVVYFPVSGTSNDGFIFTNNSLLGNSGNAGLYIAGTSTFSNFVISGNSILDCAYGVRLVNTDASEGSISGNNITSAAASANGIISDADQCNISGNYIKLTNGAAKGIHCTAVADATVQGNQIYAAGAAVEGIDMTSCTSSAVLANNVHLPDITTDTAFIGGTSGVLLGNRVFAPGAPTASTAPWTINGMTATIPALSNANISSE